MSRSSGIGFLAALGRVALATTALAAAATAEPAASAANTAGRVDAERAANPAPGDWLLHGRTWDEQRHSPLTQITRDNVGKLGLAWSYDTGTKRGLESTPIVVDGVLYATGSWSVVYALDAASGRELWRFDPLVPRSKGRDACCDVVNRGVAVWKGRVYVGALDGRLIALDAASGEKLWETPTVDAKLPYTVTGAPRIAKGLVILGNGGAEFGVRGYVSAYDPDSGALRWRFYTVPANKDGPHEHEELQAAAKTWPANSLWESGLGGTVWDSMAWDPELDLLYVGSGNASVYNREQRSPGGGDNLYLASILALRPDTGRLVWHYQTTPGDQWDYTATQHILLADIRIDGDLRKVLIQAPKNGFFYVLDRATGELLSAEKFTHVSWATHVDLSTGRPVEREEANWSRKGSVVAPAVVGAHNWHPMSFHPKTGLVYIPSIHNAYFFEPDPDFRFTPGRFNTAEDFAALSAIFEGYEFFPRLTCDPTGLLAWDPATQKKVWEVRHRYGVPGGILTTAGDLVFQGSGTTFSAYDAASGKRLWSTAVATGVMAPPVSYSVDGVQYISVLAGIGGSSGAHFASLETENDGRILTWKLGGDAAAPLARPLAKGSVEGARHSAAGSPEAVARGRDLYAEHCLRCHGAGLRSSGLYPDLRYSSRKTHEQFDPIVLGGIRAGGGMASFADVITPENSADLHAYVIERALVEPSVLETLAGWLYERGACVPEEWMTN